MTLSVEAGDDEDDGVRCLEFARQQRERDDKQQQYEEDTPR